MHSFFITFGFLKILANSFMFLRLSLLVIGVSLSLQLIAQNLISHTIIHHYTEQELEEMWKENKISQWIVPISNGIKLYEIIYTTSWHDGSKMKIYKDCNGGATRHWLKKSSSIFILERKTIPS